MTRSHVAALRPLLATLLALVPVGGACLHEVDDEIDFFEPEDDRSNEALQGLYDCTEHSDNGYRQGSRFDISVVTVDGRPTEVNTANAYIAMQDAARRDGVSLRIVSGFRTQSQQEYLYGCYVDCDCNACNVAARPGYSNHQSGHALDLNSSDSGVSTWLNRNAARFGFSRTVPSEPWHWEWWGSADDYDGPCGGVTTGGNGGGGTNGGGGSGGGGTGGGSATPPACAALPAAGGIIDDGDGCFVAGGPTQYLRAVEGAGHDGDLLWTGTTNHSSAVSFAEWYVSVPAGRYVVEAYVDTSAATSQLATYAVHHAGKVDRVLAAQTSTGWKNLGPFTFAANGTQKIRVDDNTGEAGSLGRQLVFDAVRLTPQECPRLEVVTDGAPLNVRPTAGTARAAVGALPDGTIVDRRSTTSGQAVGGTTDWHQIQTASLVGWVSGAFVVCTQ